jgi:hypothetical protein
MARVRKNQVMQGLTGLIGDQILVRTDKAGRTIVGSKPTFKEDRTFSAAQLEHHQEFREGVIYARANKDLEVYKEKAAGTPQNAYNVAMSDWFNAPEIKVLDTSAWSGQPGEVIRVWAIDDVKVNSVSVEITRPDGTLLEKGEAVQVDAMWWDYTTTASAVPGARVKATAIDLPSNIAEMIQD